MLGRQLGKRAMLIGALANSLPDIDAIAVLWLQPFDNLLAHRGFTHSIVFDVLISLLLAWLASYTYRNKQIGFSNWFLFFIITISFHLLLDVFNNYGTAILEPFDHTRYSLNAAYVSDPFLMVWPLTAFIALLWLKKESTKRRWWWIFGITGSVLYLSYCAFNKIRVEDQVQTVLRRQLGTFEDHLTTPAPLNNWLWFVVVKKDSGYYAGYHSVFSGTKPIQLTYFARNEELLSSFTSTEELADLQRFSQGWYRAELRSDTVVFNDLRFGQVVGWHDPNERFAFSYYLGKPAKANRTVVQRGRLAKWNRSTIRSMMKKIRE